ncbi:MAG: A/G-specific adenine glycosylase [Silicimonas sp.]|nr:A/G-specific adenine glycosylase [Silicimonas sp.]
MRDLCASDLLDWYDAHARDLPWRVGPRARAAGQRPDPYHVWLSEIMLQQTTVAAVRAYFLRFSELWPTVEELAAAEDTRVMAEWAGLGYYARARNLLKCARQVVTDHGGAFPTTREMLLTLPGVGPYTASAIAAIAFDEVATVVDGNVERVVSRLFEVETPLPKAKAELTEIAGGLTPMGRPGDYAQAVMDLGATICTPKSPACGICPWMQSCGARASGRQAKFPVKAPKKVKPVRYGIVYLARRSDGAWLVETRPARGLLGGMLGWPGSDWGERVPEEAPPMVADWRDLGIEVRHTFTHFHLRLSVKVADVALEAAPRRGRFKADFRRSDLPTVMRKAFDLAVGELET